MTNRGEQGKGREALHRAPPSARFYDVGGRQLMLYASGTGGPVVVFLPGAGVTGLGYLNLHEQPPGLRRPCFTTAREPGGATTLNFHAA